MKKKLYKVIKNYGYEDEDIVLVTDCVYTADEAAMDLNSRGYPSIYKLIK